MFIGRTDAEAETNTLATWYKELTHWKRPWCWTGLKAGGEGDDRGWDGWMASPIQWTWVWAGSRSCWWTGKPGVLPSMGSERGRHDWAAELKATDASLMHVPEVLCRYYNCHQRGKSNCMMTRLQPWHKLLHFFFPSIADFQQLQYPANLHYTAKWLSYTHIYFFPYALSQVIEYSSLLFFHTKGNSLHLPTQTPQSIPLHFPLSLGKHKSVLFVCESVSILQTGSFAP